MRSPVRIWVGDEKKQPMVLFPSVQEVGPRNVAAAASYMLTDDFTVNLRRIYPLIGYDAEAAMKHLRVKIKEKALIEKGEIPPLSKLQKDLKDIVRATGLELLAGLFLGCLDSPARVVCPCRVFMMGSNPVPMSPALGKRPDAWADFENFTVVAEATIGVNTGPQALRNQYRNAVTHVAQILEGRESRRGYCFMVSRAQLRLPHVPSLIEEKQKELEEKHGIGNVRILAFGIDEISRMATSLYRLYPDGVPALTEAGLGELLDTLHEEMMEWISSNEPFPDKWAAWRFVELLDKHVSGQPLQSLFEL